jgi:tetratricopeptide (TPR) repeat protein
MLEDMPLRYDDLISVAEGLQERGRWDFAAKMYGHIAATHGNVKSMTIREANAWYQFGDYRRALSLIDRIDSMTISAYMIKARCLVKMGMVKVAIKEYEEAQRILEI